MAPQRNRRPGFSRRAQYGVFLGYVLAALGVVAGAVLLAISTVNPPLFASLRSGVREATTPVSSGLHMLRRAILDLPGGFGDYFGVVGENRALRAEAARNAKAIAAARLLIVENRRLRALAQVREREPTTVAAARLVNSSASSTRRFATLNAGSRHGVALGQPVRGPDGLIGRIIEVSPNTASVLLLTDTESVVPVRRIRDNLPAIVVGRGDGLVDIRTASIANAPLLAGDMFVTTGTGGLYAPGIPVARVLKSQRDTAPARTLADPDALDFALVQAAYLPAPRPPVPPLQASTP
ncbi:rod shape-determining protein MreC [Sphingomonas japonica]|uniref:Cell shape-determining protein MreC n=1 Tax=Sphingomonas japonica TaxID=511662 RepID=A0ABX0U4M8_9SPHN|nr:rod shape-determining protein MreC [Sphingomonas japonica]NIJ24754.1 rod shape-determining protein MreC [Sphingomonas japonica]